MTARIKLANVVIGCFLVIYSFLSILGALEISSKMILVLSIKIYQAFFGLLMVLSFCDFAFIERNFKFLKTVVGKGAFNLFVASTCLVGDCGLLDIIMCFGLIICGLFFVLIGGSCLRGYDELVKEE